MLTSASSFGAFGSMLQADATPPGCAINGAGTIAGATVAAARMAAKARAPAREPAWESCRMTSTPERREETQGVPETPFRSDPGNCASRVAHALEGPNIENYMTDRIRTRFLVVGSGVAGLHTAWRASAHGP